MFAIKLHELLIASLYCCLGFFFLFRKADKCNSLSSEVLYLSTHCQKYSDSDSQVIS